MLLANRCDKVGRSGQNHRVSAGLFPFSRDEMIERLELTTVASLASALVVTIVVVKWARAGNGVPGPLQVPFFGYLPFIGSSPVTKFLQLSEKYGDVYRLSFFARDYYVISGFTAIKESLSQEAVNDKFEEFNYFSDSVNWNAVTALNGSRWKQQRKIILSKVFSMSVMRDTSPKMDAIGQDLVDYLKSTDCRETNIRAVLSATALNTVTSIIYGKKYDWEDELFKRLRQDLTDFVHCMDSFFFLLGGPYFKMYMQTVHRKQDSDFLAICKRCHDTSMSIVDDKLNSEIHHGDFAAAYLRQHLEEVDANIPEEKQEFNLVVDRLAQTIFTLMQAGTDTVSETLYYAFYFMARYRDVQVKVQAELDSCVGRYGQPTLADKLSLSYTRAVIEETLRYSSLIPMGVPRQTNCDIQVAGHKIPSGSYLLHNLYSVTRDKTLFKMADHFYPEHFIDSDGNFLRAEATVPFGYGRRNCLGELLARNEVFLYFAAVLHNFELTLPSGQAELRVQEGMLRMLDNYHIIATPRP
ncbi:Cytochrome P450 2G1 [Halotydeus destructor]|nr:Cytochrome P450 2G1 [Halotydeus destructor]